ncbi:MAG: hypothetical protein EU549_03320 [Promethearchaeota archaeon]|nr:MAG: hypothetical protein EU549_03320 [Candidatus Lokiarchaeota archaeon]
MELNKTYKIYIDNAISDLINALKSAQRANKIFCHTEYFSEPEQAASIEISMRIETILDEIIRSKDKLLTLDEEDLATLDVALNLYRIKLFHNYSKDIDPTILMRLYRVHLEIRYHLMDPKYKAMIPP